MATTLNYTTQPISTRVDPRGRYYGKIESVPLSPEETVRGIMAYKKITAFSESTVLMLLNDLLQGAVELTALDGKTRTIGQMLRVYMSLEGSFATPILSYDDKSALKVRTQLLKDLKWPVDPENFSLSPKDGQFPSISAVHYSAQTTAQDAMKIGAVTIITGRNLDKVDFDTTGVYLNNPENAQGVNLTRGPNYTPSYNALTLSALADVPAAFTGAGPWPAELIFSTQEGFDYAKKNIMLYPATA